MNAQTQNLKLKDSLTVEEQARMDEYYKKYLGIGLSTEPADKPRAEAAFARLYELTGNEPVQVIWMPSIKAANDYINLCMGTTDQRIYTEFLGSGDAYWIAFYDFCATLGVTYEADAQEKLDLMRELSLSCGWWYPYSKAIIAVDRPCEIHMEEVELGSKELRLHNQTGPSVKFRDGYEVYAWHGVLVPNEWYVNKPSAKTLLNWSNIEQRRAGCEMVGWGEILTELDAQLIDKDDPEIGELYEADLPDSGKERFLKVQCGTGRTFVIPVPPEMTTALEANAWTYGLGKLEYSPEVRT